MEDTNIKNFIKIFGLLSIFIFAIGILSVSIEASTVNIAKNLHLMSFYMRNSSMPNIYHINEK
ncbi:MAG: hypothetical protein ACD_19C00017G0013 [uncultured bacterium]|nr:MAG: hypothetical protein ACD_19C00017G0013 [uncultured bacterium]